MCTILDFAFSNLSLGFKIEHAFEIKVYFWFEFWMGYWRFFIKLCDLPSAPKPRYVTANPAP